MLNNVKKGLGYRDIIYNVRLDKFFTYEVGDQFQELDIETGGGTPQVPSGGTNDKPSDPGLKATCTGTLTLRSC